MNISGAPQNSTKNATKKRRKRTKKDRVSTLKRWGLLRHGVSKVPALLISLELLLAHGLHFLAHSLLVVGVAIETLGGRSGNQAKGQAEAHALTRQLGVLVFDTGLGFLQAMLTLLGALGLPIVGEDGMVVLRRLALLHSASASLLYLSAVARWRRRAAGAGAAPPLFLLLAYFAAPWSGLSVWLATVRPGDHQLGGGAWLDMLALCGLLVVRAALFGQHCSPRMPRVPRTLDKWLLDLAVLGSAVAIFDIVVLRCAWLERLKNWKYVICALNMAWPWPFIFGIARFFRREARGSRQDAELDAKAPRHSTARRAAAVASAAAAAARGAAPRLRLRRRSAVTAAPAPPVPMGGPWADEEVKAVPGEEPRLPVLGLGEGGRLQAAPGLPGAPAKRPRAEESSGLLERGGPQPGVGDCAEAAADYSVLR